MGREKSLIFLALGLILSAQVALSQPISLVKEHQLAMTQHGHGLSLRFIDELMDGQSDRSDMIISSPPTSDQLYWMARVNLEKRNYGEAINFYQQTLELEPLYPGINEALSYSFYCLKNYEEAINYHRKVVDSYGEKGAYQMAYAYRQRLSLSYLIAGDSHLARGEEMAAFHSYKMAYSSNQLSVAAQVRLAMSYLSLYNNSLKALTLINKALSLEQSEAIRRAYVTITDALDQL